MTLPTIDATLIEVAGLLRSGSTVPVIWSGDARPAGDQYVAVDLIDAADAADFEPGDVVRVQVNAWGRLLSDAVRLMEQRSVTMRAAGFTRRNYRRSPAAAGDTLKGVLAEFIR